MRLIKNTEEAMNSIKEKGKPIKWQFMKSIETDGYMLPDGTCVSEDGKWIRIYEPRCFEKFEKHDYGDYVLVIV